MIDRVAVLFLAGSALFGAVLLGELNPEDPDAPPAATPAPAPEQIRVPQQPQGPRTVDLVATTLSRLLFSATRPPAERVAPDRPGDPELTNVRLTGIVVEPDQRTAIFAVQGAKPLVRTEGETVNDWQLDSIAPHERARPSPSGAPWQATATPRRPGRRPQPEAWLSPARQVRRGRGY
jgi:hypothetical protein